MVTNGDRNTSKKSRPVRVSAAKKTELLKHAEYRGIFTRVARQLGVDRSYVSRVANGQRHSAKVEAALLSEIKRIEKASKKAK
jgi:predicted XRE-type DNA-binding protein